MGPSGRADAPIGLEVCSGAREARARHPRHSVHHRVWHRVRLDHRTPWAHQAGIAISMGSRGDAYDNPVAETFYATLKKELVNRRTWPSRLKQESAVFEYIEAIWPPPPALHPEHHLASQLRTTPTLSARPLRAIARLRKSTSTINPQGARKPARCDRLDDKPEARAFAEFASPGDRVTLCW